ncbi:MAG: ATP-binding protein, partial [Butyricicoccaceae bacterium]
ISRTTGRGGLMQEFSARYADTNEECLELTSRDCGRTLTGVGEQGYQSSALIDGTDLTMATEELDERMLALSSTGDNAAAYARAVSQLDRWRLELKGTGGRGKLGEVEAELEQTLDGINRIDQLQEDIAASEARLPQVQEQLDVAVSDYEQTYEEFNTVYIARRERTETEERRAREELQERREMLPELRRLEAAEQAKKAYEQADQGVKAAEQEVRFLRDHFEDEWDKINRAEDDYSTTDYGASDIHIRWWSMGVAIVMGVLAVLSLFQVLPLGGVMPYLFSILAVIFLIITFLGSTKSLSGPPMDFDSERAKLERRRQTAGGKYTQATEKFETARNRLIDAAQAIEPEVVNEWQALELITDLALQRMECEAFEKKYLKIRKEYLEIIELTGPSGAARANVEKKKQAMEDLREEQTGLREHIAQCKGKSEAIGVREDLIARRDLLTEERRDILWHLDAITAAKDALVKANTELTGRMSPEINRYAQEYLEALTDGKYTELTLGKGFEAECRTESGTAALDALKLSSGTRDQLYLALRLAACKVLLDEGDESVPLVLDDPFLTYDDERTACGMKLLRQIAKERQVILLTCKRPA